MKRSLFLLFIPVLLLCSPIRTASAQDVDYTITADNTHNKWSRTIEPILAVDPGAVIEAFLVEASGGAVTVDSRAEDIPAIGASDPFHALTGPVFVRGAEPGDVLAVTLHEIEVQDWGWSAIFPGFGFLSEEYTEPYMKIFHFEPGDTSADFGNGIEIPFRPFPGVMGVAPDTDSLLSTIPPRANGGNMDDKDLVVGTTVYFPVFVDGALFSIGDPHVVQGDGEVSGTAIEGSLRTVYEINLIKDGSAMPSPQYETDTHYSVTGFGVTIDDAARMATRAMIDYIMSETDLSREEAYILASLSADLKIAETVDIPHMLATMKIPKDLF
ncbi:MAG: acetamidase/formamidase family protein [Rhodothermales bacterium]|nr:acetamidase/formamidase family protein [Rhodothermales bacterium]